MKSIIDVLHKMRLLINAVNRLLKEIKKESR